MSIESRWFGPGERPLHGYLHVPDGAPRAAVILCAPIGYEAWSAYATYRVLAERLAARGAIVLRFDYDGTHDSAGTYTDPERVTAWQASIRAAIDELAALAPVALVGLRVGATLAYLAADARVGELVLWDTVVAGKRFVRELKALSATGEGAAANEGATDGSLAIAGTVHTADTLAALAQIDLLAAPKPAARRILVIERDDRPSAGKLIEHLGCEAQKLPGTAQILDVAVEHGRIPESIVDAIAAWITIGEPRGAQLPPRSREARIGNLVEEPFVSDARGLHGILTRSEAPKSIVVFGSSGTEHHVGPGRTWVDFSRLLAAEGRDTLRVDFSGIGESRQHGPPRRQLPYDLAHVDDFLDITASLRARGYDKIVLVGLCAGAWMAIHAALADPALAGIIAINPQLYWKPGDPIDILISESAARRGPEWQREARLAAMGVYDLLDIQGDYAPAARWLDSLRVPTLLAFAERDLGLLFLERRCGRRLQHLLQGETITLVEIAGIDHPMHRYRKRPEMIQALRDFLGRIGA